MSILLLLALSVQVERLTVEGPPFLVLGETVELRALAAVDDATVVWRVADAPGGALAAIETTPAYDTRTRTVRGTGKLAVKSVGKMEGDLLLAVSLERSGKRLASTEFRVKIGPVLTVRAWCRTVQHRRGGTGRPEMFSDSDRRKVLEEDVNRLLRPLGVAVSLEVGKPVAAPDAWFDREGRFHPVALKNGENARSLTLQELLKHNEPGGLNIFLVRDCHWTTVQEGFVKVVTNHSLIGIGLKDGQVVLDDGFDAPSLAHELGHAFSLDDLNARKECGRMMYSIRSGRTGTMFSWQEMKDARERARLHLRAQR